MIVCLRRAVGRSQRIGPTVREQTTEVRPGLPEASRSWRKGALPRRWSNSTIIGLRRNAGAAGCAILRRCPSPTHCAWAVRYRRRDAAGPRRRTRVRALRDRVRRKWRKGRLFFILLDLPRSGERDRPGGFMALLAIDPSVYRRGPSLVLKCASRNGRNADRDRRDAEDVAGHSSSPGS